MHKKIAVFGFVLTGLILAIGTYWAFDRGANDFSVFYSAWKLVLEGQGSRVYGGTTDRYLYAPGFAWLLSPLALLPRSIALAFWCLAKAAVIGYVLRAFATRLSSSTGALAASFAVALLAKPLLIDFQYGQVNCFILGACVWALVPRFDERSGNVLDFVRWFALAAAAVAKIFPLPLLVVPWLVTGGLDSKKIRLERLGLVCGLLVVLGLPFLTEGVSTGVHLFSQWRSALVERGFPMESHNQSFAAFLHHYLSGAPTHVISHGWTSVPYGLNWLSADTIRLLSLSWTAITMALLLGWILSGVRVRSLSLSWAAVAIGMLVVPSYLVWKPYALMSIPAAILVLDSAFQQVLGSRRWMALIGAVVLFFLANLTGFDFIGYEWAGRLEAASILLVVQLALLGLVWRRTLA